MSIRPYLEWRPAIERNVWNDPAAIAMSGDDCTVGHGVILHACAVGNRCLIGTGTIVMDGAVIGDEVIVGAGSLVPARKTLPSRTLWVGSPARPQRALDAEEIAYLAESAAHYVALKNDYLRQPQG